MKPYLDPYRDIKVVHLARLISSEGDISPLCAKRPRKLNLKLSKWTTDKTAVTCEKCKKLMGGY